ncbi:MAG: DNA repair protein RecO [Pyrinomonadaceae bacterium]
MPLYETESLVLKSYNLAEADRIVVFFTREQGMVRGVAKGAKRLKSRFGSTLELFSTVNLSYFQKEERELVSIQTVELTKSCFAEASSPEFLNTFSYIADLLMSFVPPHDPNATLYRMTKACLAAAVGNPETLDSIRLYFELWLLRLGGYLPDWSTCDICKRLLTVQESTRLQSSFHLRCGGCGRTNSGDVITPAHREVFHNVQKLSPGEFIEYVYGKPAYVSEVSNALKRIISQVIGREVQSEKKLAMP